MAGQSAKRQKSSLEPFEAPQDFNLYEMDDDLISELEDQTVLPRDEE